MTRLLTPLLAVLALASLACQTGERPPTPIPGHLEVHFVDVGQGDGIFIRSPEGLVMVIDGGPRDSGMSGYLKRHGVKTVDVLIGTHPEADHIGGLIEVLKQLPVRNVYIDDQVHTTRTYADFLAAIQASEATFHEARRGQRIPFGTATVEVLHPVEPFLPGDLDENSVVVRLQYGQVSFLFTGDLGKVGEQSILSAGLDVSATILKLGHHGSSTSSSPAFLKAVAPQVAVYQAGRDNPYGHPHREVVQAVAELGIPLYGTKTHGTVVIRTNGQGYTIETQRGAQEEKETQPRSTAPLLVK
jgi:competence protein ComEC